MDTKKPSKHMQAINKVQELFSKINKISNPYLNADDMSLIGLRMSKVDITKEEESPMYFRPASKAWLASFDNQRGQVRSIVSSKYATEGEQTYFQGMAVQSNITQHFMAIHKENIEKAVWEYYTLDTSSVLNRMDYIDSPKDEYQQRWALSNLFNTPFQDSPHITCTSRHGIEDIEKVGPLLRSEVICILAIIFDQMTAKTAHTHFVFPVLMVSYIGTNARIILAHFDCRTHLIYIRSSCLHSFSRMDKGHLDLILRWRFSDPIGDTTTPVPQPNAQAGKIDSSSKQVSSTKSP